MHRRSRKLTWFGLLCLAGFIVNAGCGSDSDDAARYQLEKALWEAQQIRSRIYSNPLKPSHDDFRAAVSLYERILSNERFTNGDAGATGKEFSIDIQRGLLRCKMTLTELYFVDYKQNASVTYPMYGVFPRDLILRDDLDKVLGKVLALYRTMRPDSAEERCVRMFQRVTSDAGLWNRSVPIGDTLMVIPNYLAQVELTRAGGVEGDYCRFAHGFYSRVIQTWPDSLVGRKARLSRADLYTMLERYEDALADVDAVLASGGFAEHPGEIPLLRGEILAHGLGRFAEAESVFTTLRALYVGSGVSRRASLDLAAVMARRGETTAAVEMIRELEAAEETQLETQAAAMFLRALIVHENGDRREGGSLLWRICRLYPSTRAGMAAPLVILRHELGAGTRENVERVHRKTVEFYVSAIEKDSASLRHRHVVQDFLIESYLLMGDPRGAAMVLEDNAPNWSGEYGVVGLMKSALIYLNLVEDRENGVRMLEKCLDLYPVSLYIEYVRAQLDSLTRLQTVQ